ncbi:MAG: Hsp70 family protein [Bacteroidia bacterium]
MPTKIDFGIDLGTTNSAIAKMENGKPMIVSTGRSEIISSCVAIQIGGGILVGDRAKTIYAQESEREVREGIKPNSYIEFKREMSNPFTYPSSNLGRDISPEELSAEVLKKLKSFVTTEKLNSIVITVPAKFSMAQKQATTNAGKLAGFELVVLLEEPVAACLAFNMEKINNKGTWLVFDFGGGTFDAAIVKKDNDGMMKVIDTGGDIELGGKDLDFAIVDNLILPYLKKTYELNSYFLDAKKKDFLRTIMKRFAEDAKLELSFQLSTDLLKTYPGDINLQDDNGKDICLSIDFDQNILYKILESNHQRAINLALKVLQRNYISKESLDAIILVGGPTLSPIFQKMIKAQISERIDTSINPMTIVAKGAALFASTKDAPPPHPEGEEIVLDVDYESATIEEDTLINIKINTEKTKSQLPDKIKYILQRKDGSFVTDSEVLTNNTALIELQLVKGETNVFNIHVIDVNGNNLSCIPNEITFIPIFVPPATNNYYIGIEIWDINKEIRVFKGLKGLEKNMPLKNAVGVINNIKNPKQIVPGKSDDSLEIRIFQGEDDAEGKNSFLSDHVTSIIITGDDAEKLIPSNSELEVTLRFDENGSMPNCTVFFPGINWKHEVKLNDFKRNEVDAVWLRQEIKNDIKRVEKYLNENNSHALETSLNRLNELDQNLTNNEGNQSGRITVLNKVRENRREIENHISEDEWPEVSEELKSIFYRAESLVQECKNGQLDSSSLNMNKVESHLEEFRTKVEQVIIQKETQLAKELSEEIEDFSRSVYFKTQEEGLRQKLFVEYLNENFNQITWLDPTNATQLINQANLNIQNKGSISQLETICSEIYNLIDRTVNQPDIPVWL